MTFDPSVSAKLQQSILTWENDPSFLRRTPSTLGLRHTTSPRSWGSEVFCTLRTSYTSEFCGDISWKTEQAWLWEWEMSQPGHFFVVPALVSYGGILFLSPFFLEDHESFLPTTQPAAYSSTLIDQLSSRISERPYDWFETGKGQDLRQRVRYQHLHGLYGSSRLLKTLRPGGELISLYPQHVLQSTSRHSEEQSPALASGPLNPRYASLFGDALTKELPPISMEDRTGEPLKPRLGPSLGYDMPF